MLLINLTWEEKDKLRLKLFSSAYLKSETNCWISSLTPSGKYPQLQVKSKLLMASRIAYSLMIGMVSINLFVCHKCDNPRCINPNHLFLGSAQDNSNDMIRKGRQNIGINNPMAQLTEEQVKNIKQRINNGETNSSIAQNFPVNHKLISKIRTGKRWGHINVIA